MICCESMCQLFSNTGKLEKKLERTPGTILSYYQAGGCDVILRRFPTMIKASRSRKFSRWIRKKIAKFEKQKSTIFPPWLPPFDFTKCQKCQKKSVTKTPWTLQNPIWIPNFNPHLDPSRWPVQRVQVLRGLRKNGTRWAFDLDDFFVESTAISMAWNGLGADKFKQFTIVFICAIIVRWNFCLNSSSLITKTNL